MTQDSNKKNGEQVLEHCSPKNKGYSMYKHKLDSIQGINLSNFDTINQTSHAPTVSDKYTFISTSRVLDVLQDHGWRAIKAVEARAKKNAGYQKHAITLVNDAVNRNLSVGETIPQLILTNSHSGNSSFSFHLSLLELVCKNGLLVGKYNETLRVTHRGYADIKVEQILGQVISGFIDSLKNVEKYRLIELDKQQQQEFAKKALEMRLDKGKYVLNPDSILCSRRKAQKEPTLWNTFNVIQEFIIKGGFRAQRKNDYKRTRFKAINAIDENIRLNKKLWELMLNIAASTL